MVIVFIPLTKGKIAAVDFCDFNMVRGVSWHVREGVLGRSSYAANSVRIRGTKKKKTILMHSVICSGDEVDHINGNGLDNRRCNLRSVSHAMNHRGFRKIKPGKVGYRGVTWHAKDKMWRARIKGETKDVFLGNFKSPIDAAIAYDSAAIRFGYSLSALNFRPNGCDFDTVL